MIARHWLLVISNENQSSHSVNTSLSGCQASLYYVACSVHSVAWSRGKEGRKVLWSCVLWHSADKGVLHYHWHITPLTTTQSYYQVWRLPAIFVWSLESCVLVFLWPHESHHHHSTNFPGLFNGWTNQVEGNNSVNQSEIVFVRLYIPSPSLPSTGTHQSWTMNVSCKYWEQGNYRPTMPEFIISGTETFQDLTVFPVCQCLIRFKKKLLPYYDLGSINYLN